MIRLAGGSQLVGNKVTLCQYRRSLGCDFHIRAPSPPGWDIKTKLHQGLSCWRRKNNEGLLHRWLGCLVGHTAQLVSNKEKDSLVIHQHNPPPPSLFWLIPIQEQMQCECCSKSTKRTTIIIFHVVQLSTNPTHTVVSVIPHICQ